MTNVETNTLFEEGNNLIVFTKIKTKDFDSIKKFSETDTIHMLDFLIDK